MPLPVLVPVLLAAAGSAAVDGGLQWLTRRRVSVAEVALAGALGLIPGLVWARSAARIARAEAGFRRADQGLTGAYEGARASTGRLHGSVGNGTAQRVDDAERAWIAAAEELVRAETVRSGAVAAAPFAPVAARIVAEQAPAPRAPTKAPAPRAPTRGLVNSLGD